MDQSHEKLSPQCLEEEEAAVFCHAPFAQVLLSPTGNIYPCCHHFGYKIGNGNSSFQETWNGPALRKLRQEFLQGQPKICRSRIRNLACHREFDHLAEFTDLKVQQSKPPIRIDVRLNGQCNLKCVMCDVWQQPNKFYDNTWFWKYGPTELFPYLKEIEILGGEPFIQTDTYRLIRILAKVNPQVKVSFITNGSYLNIKRVLDHLRLIDLKMLQVSLDSLNPETYLKIRQGGDIDIVLKNIDAFADLKRTYQSEGLDFEFKISFCILKYNWREIPKFFEFCRSKNATPELQFAFYDPSGHSRLLDLPTDELKNIERILLDQTPSEDRPQLESFLTPIRQRLFQNNANSESL